MNWSTYISCILLVCHVNEEKPFQTMTIKSYITQFVMCNLLILFFLLLDSVLTLMVYILIPIFSHVQPQPAPQHTGNDIMLGDH